MSTADPGFEQDHILTASVGLGIAGYPPSEENAIQHKILDRVAALPGVKVAALTDWLPLSFNGRSSDVYPENYVPQLHESHEVRRADVTPGFFTAMGIPIVAGRDFHARRQRNRARRRHRRSDRGRALLARSQIRSAASLSIRGQLLTRDRRCEELETSIHQRAAGIDGLSELLPELV